MCKTKHTRTNFFVKKNFAKVYAYLKTFITYPKLFFRCNKILGEPQLTRFFRIADFGLNRLTKKWGGKRDRETDEKRERERESIADDADRSQRDIYGAPIIHATCHCVYTCIT